MKRLWIYLFGIFLVYFQISFLNLFSLYKLYFNVDLVALFVYSLYIYTEIDILDVVIILGILSDLLSNTLLGLHSMIYFIIFIIMKFSISKFNLSNFFKYLFVLLFGVMHTLMYSLLLKHLTLLSYVEFSTLLLLIVFLLNLKKNSSGWFD